MKPSTLLISPHKAKLDLAITTITAAAARAGATGAVASDLEAAIDLILDVQDMLQSVTEALLAEAEADEQFVKQAKNDRKRKAA